MHIEVDSEAFLDFLSAIRVLDNEAIFTYSPTGLSAILLDPAKVALVKVDIPPDICTVSEIDTEIKVGVNVTKVSQIISDYTGPMRIILSEDKASSVYADGAHRLDSRHLDPATIKVPQSVPVPGYTSYATVSGKDMYPEVKKMNTLSEVTFFKLYPSMDMMMIKTKDDIQDKFESDIPATEYSGTDAESQLSSEYLYDMFKYLSGNKAIRISTGTDKPIELTSVMKSGVHVLFMLAPRIEND